MTDWCRSKIKVLWITALCLLSVFVIYFCGYIQSPIQGLVFQDTAGTTDLRRNNSIRPSYLKHVSANLSVEVNTRKHSVNISLEINNVTDHVQKASIESITTGYNTEPMTSKPCSIPEVLTNQHATNNNNSLSEKIKVAVLIPSTTRTLKNPSLEGLPLMTLCLPSLIRTFAKDYFYKVFIGIDKGDYLETVQVKIKAMYDNLEIFVVRSSTFTQTLNEIACRAYKQGMDYFVRINDDTEFTSADWTALGIATLKSYDPPNIGVVGPTCKEGNTAIMTHDMTHKIHQEIFGYYYPPYFDNWWVDDWITNVYKPDRSTKLSTWTVKHLVQYQRYDVDFSKEKQLQPIVLYDNKRLIKYITAKRGN